jgi:hypothetical protein
MFDHELQFKQDYFTVIKSPLLPLRAISTMIIELTDTSNVSIGVTQNPNLSRTSFIGFFANDYAFHCRGKKINDAILAPYGERC